MVNIISIQSFRKGAGKSQIAANVAVLLAGQGQHVALLETNLQAPDVNSIFSQHIQGSAYCFDDFLLHRCRMRDTLRNVTKALGNTTRGELYLVPCNSHSSSVARLLEEGYDLDLLREAVDELDSYLGLDTIIIDTAAGLNEQTLYLMALSSAVGITLFLEQSAFQGTAVMVEVARKLEVPKLALLVNGVGATFDLHQVKAEAEHSYACPVAAVLPHAEELVKMAGRGIFVLNYPKHPLTLGMDMAAAAMVANSGNK